MMFLVQRGLHCILAISAVIPVVLCGQECSESRKQHYRWTAKCEGSSFTPKITINDVDVLQGGSSVRNKSGIDLSKPLEVVLQLDSYTLTLHDPYLNMKADMYSKGKGNGGCSWSEVIGRQDIGNLNPCLVIDEDCTLHGNPRKIHLKINFKDVSGQALQLLPADELYGIESTITDGSTPIFCFRIEHLVLKT